MNVLILTGSFGMGHKAAARAIAEQIADAWPDARIQTDDFLKLAFRSEIYTVPFRQVVRQGKTVNNLVFRLTADAAPPRKLPFESHLFRILEERIAAGRADVIISTLPACSQIVSAWKEARGSRIPLITCITDVSSHREWLWPQTDNYLAAAPSLKDELVHQGVPAPRILVSGIPVRRVFRPEAGSASGRPGQRGDGQKHVLVMGGGLGLLPKAKNIYGDLSLMQGVRTSIITGDNQRLYRSLYRRFENLEVLGYVENVAGRMGDADLLLTKPGGITMFEAIAMELPLLVFPPTLHQEILNAAFIESENLGLILSEDEGSWIPQLIRLLKDDGKLAEIRSNMKKLKQMLDPNALITVLKMMFPGEDK